MYILLEVFMKNKAIFFALLSMVSVPAFGAYTIRIQARRASVADSFKMRHGSSDPVVRAAIDHVFSDNDESYQALEELLADNAGLVNRKSVVSITSDNGDSVTGTLLGIAIAAVNERLVDLFLRYGGDDSIRDSRGMSGIERAQKALKNLQADDPRKEKSRSIIRTLRRKAQAAKQNDSQKVQNSFLAGIDVSMPVQSASKNKRKNKNNKKGNNKKAARPFIPKNQMPEEDVDGQPEIESVPADDIAVVPDDSVAVGQLVEDQDLKRLIQMFRQPVNANARIPLSSTIKQAFIQKFGLLLEAKKNQQEAKNNQD